MVQLLEPTFPNSTSVLVQWSEPTVPNGIITSYEVNVSILMEFKYYRSINGTNVFIVLQLGES